MGDPTRPIPPAGPVPGGNTMPGASGTPAPLTPDEYEKLRMSLKRINLKAQRVQDSTSQEMKLRALSLRFMSFVDLVGSFRTNQGPDRGNVDREWRNCKRFEIAAVRGHLRRPETQSSEIAAVAQVELKATVGKLDTEMTGNNWGIVAQQLCPDLEGQIDDAIQECRRVTERELLEIFTISENL